MKEGVRRSLLCVPLLLAGTALANNSVHITYLWHLEQPIYWPDRSLDNPNRYQAAWESMTDSGSTTHPQNDLEEIFGKADRVEVYQYSIRDTLSATSGSVDMGAQVSYPGDLIENIDSLADAGWTYSPSWNSAYSQARTWKTSGGQPRLDLVLFPHHHPIAALVEPETLRKEIQTHKALYPQTWGNNPGISKGFFPAETAFSTRIVETLAQEGIEWSIVGSNHISRSCVDYPFNAAQDNTVPPNLADQLNPAQNRYYSMSISRGITTKEAYPFAYTPHYVRYVNPATGVATKMVVIPMAQGMSWQDGYAPYSTNDIDAIASTNNSAHPMLILLGHDGDNAYAGGWSYYHQDVPNFVNQAGSKGYSMSTVQQYLKDHPVDPSDVIQVEDGPWVNADGDFGSPQFINWLWPPTNTSGQVDVINGWGEDFRNWAVLVAGQHRAIHAEAIQGTARADHMLLPTSTSTQAERAWHFLLAGTNAGYMYYGTSLDMEVKQTVAANEAMVHADQAIGTGATDTTAPTVFVPQRHPWNPGGYCAGALCGYKLTEQPKEFYVWTFAYDTSGVSEISLKVRVDTDGRNPLDDDANELYAGGPGVGSWTSLPMTKRAGSTFVGNINNNPEINFDEMPKYIADEYYALVSGYEDQLLDYYIEARDSRGNVKKSPIQHVWVGSVDVAPPSNIYTATPNPAYAGESLTITYDAVTGSLPDAPSKVTLHWGYDSWKGITDTTMTLTGSVWSATITVPAAATKTVDFVFTDGSKWDNNGGADYHVAVTTEVLPTEPPPNTPPVASAGEDQTIVAGDSITLDGRGSSDADGDPLTYSWSLDGVVVGTSDVVMLPAVEVGTYTYVLTVSDGQDSASDTVVVTVEEDTSTGGCGPGAGLVSGGLLLGLVPLLRRRRTS